MTIAVTSVAMKTNIELIRPAGSAIAAVLALTATSAMAQDAGAPEIVVPTVPTTSQTAPAQTTPQIVIPDPTPSQTAAIAPTVEAEPVPTISEDPVAAEDVNPAPAAVAASEPSTRVANVAAADPSPIQQSDIAGDAESAGVPLIDDAIESDPALATASAATATPVSDPSSGDETKATLAMAGGAAALGLGFIGLFMAGSARRRRGDRHGTTAATTDERKTLPLRKDPAKSPAAAVAPTVAATAGRARPERRQPNVTYGGGKWDDPGFVNASPAMGVLPGGEVPRSAEGRRALLERLVRARPDEANPFRSPKARRRRARLIIQSLNQRLREQPNLDFRRFYQGFAKRRHAVA